MGDQDPRPAPGEPFSRQGIDREHQTIRDILERMDSTIDIEPLWNEVRRLQPLLREHFDSEESADGFFAMLRERLPGNFHRVDNLQHEHEAFVRELMALDAACRACLEGPIADVCRKARLFAQRIRAHEAQETELLGDAFLNDLGGRG